jgi:competence protein ComEC
MAAVPAWAYRQAWPFWLIASLSWTWLAIDARLDARLAPALAGGDVNVSGWVDGFPRESSGQVSFSFRVTGSECDIALPSRLRLTWYDPPLEIRAGGSYELTVRLKPPRGLVNPGGFDFERWLFLEGYGATGYVRDGGAASERFGSLARAWLERRAAMAVRIGDVVVNPDARALLTALALGERFGFTDDHWAAFRRTGTSHLVAISGLHVGIVSGLLFFAARWLWLRGPAVLAVYDLEVAALVSFMGAFFYTALAGFSIPTQRALIMLLVGLLALTSRRVTTMAAGLSAAVLFVLLWDPLAPLSASFWLSFAAVALLWQLGNLRVGGSRDGAAARVRQTLCNVGRVQWGVTIGLVPIVVMAFGELSIVSPLVNVVAIPFFSLVLVPLTLLATATLSVAFVGMTLLAVAAALADWSYAALAMISEYPWAALPMPALGIGSAALLCAGATAALPMHALPGRYLAWVAMLGPLLSTPRGPAARAFEATVLDVGHGLAVLVRTRARSLLFDAGARYPSGFDSGEEIVLPALRSLGIKTLDAIVISHADNDHAGGLGAVLEAFPRATLIAGPDLQMRQAISCRRGQRWEWDGVLFEIAHPSAAFPLLGNDSSCVLKVSTADHALLLTGDVERAAERSLVAAGLDLTADVVVVPHHGSATSSTGAFTTATRPKVAIVSAGYANQWGFPKEEVVARWARVGATTVVTGEAGAVSLTFAPDDRFEMSTGRARRHRAWRMDTD